LYKKRTGNEVEYLEFCQLASVGLLEAIDQYEPARGVLFTTFCTPRVRGSVLNGPSAISEAQEQGTLAHRLQKERMASLSEGKPIRTKLPDAFSAICEVAAGVAIGFMLDDTGMYSDPDAVPLSVCDGYRTVAWRQTQDCFKDAIEQLGEREKKLIMFHYFHGLSFDQVSDILGVSKGRVSQLHRSALLAMRAYLKPANVSSWLG
jgi:RNA polymerase sigma factor for flagellar operon FliA